MDHNDQGWTITTGPYRKWTIPTIIANYSRHGPCLGILEVCKVYESMTERYLSYTCIVNTIDNVCIMYVYVYDNGSVHDT